MLRQRPPIAAPLPAHLARHPLHPVSPAAACSTLSAALGPSDVITPAEVEAFASKSAELARQMAAVGGRTFCRAYLGYQREILRLLEEGKVVEAKERLNVQAFQRFLTARRGTARGFLCSYINCDKVFDASDEA
jgi:hypothetical protein